jgi:benzoyl-CoA reductase/2-hydroxyglutaryl-CoA dehydratase subunit BcrC/BadD/HgdB
MSFNRSDVAHLINDEFIGEAPKRALQYIQKKRASGMPVAGAYCVYAPVEIIRAAGAVPAILCAFANKTIQAGEAVLPANLCPLVKSSLGFIVTDTCPFFALSDAVIAETTCDGKKKMFELISHYRPMHVMDLPQMPDEREAQANWASRNREVKAFLEKTFSRAISEARIEEEIKATNRRNRLMARLLEYAANQPPLMSWSEFYEIAFLAQVAFLEDIEPILEKALETLAVRQKEGIRYGKSNAPRVLVTGTPLGGDALKVYRIIEEAGGVVVAMDNCTGMKPFVRFLEEDTGDPISAISRYYLKIPCACMTPNTRRLDEIDRLVDLFKPDAVIDVVLHACHTYNIESYKIMNHAKDKHRLPFLKIETDYADGDVEQIRTRVEALFDSLT